MVRGSLDGKIGLPADDVSDHDEELSQDCYGVGFALRLDRSNDLAADPLVCLVVEDRPLNRLRQGSRLDLCPDRRLLRLRRP